MTRMRTRMRRPKDDTVGWMEPTYFHVQTEYDCQQYWLHGRGRLKKARLEVDGVDEVGTRNDVIPCPVRAAVATAPCDSRL